MLWLRLLTLIDIDCQLDLLCFGQTQQIFIHLVTFTAKLRLPGTTTKNKKKQTQSKEKIQKIQYAHLNAFQHD